MTIAIYPGSFDPITNGHLDVIERASRLFDEVVVGVLSNSSKSPMFTAEERVSLIEEAVKPFGNVRVAHFQGLLVDYVKSNQIDVIIKGLRAISDFEAEFQMAAMNRHLGEGTETVFLMTDVHYSYLSSSLVKEVFRFNGDIKGLVPDHVLAYMQHRLR
ncbi:pantetheine-phosphate adenylyltransferase [Acidaminobacter sp.]|uniref:pantetheine-phosphate adenylyltransferase n=1 Tax=Acidaminobacter sp. TaxID=1872102 RepID=UPI00137F6A6C|nr:pantetheine-phosphate adenylyltransferase [Acidaminobacter sp.]MDK9709615.1 pantetheine-phosphate adenylyltransferase [Acidaminobacter sp.]MZQ97864.1 pantetheine-phosphate adenylyltransferase [Acidaminobacter sp.]